MLGVGLAGVGLYLTGTAVGSFPLTREQLAVADHVGPISIDTPLVQEWNGRHRSNYRTQHIPLTAAGERVRIYAPAPTLWVRDTDNIRYGQQVRFLVDPDRALVYEATSQGRTLLAYDETAENLSGSARTRLLAGLGLIALAAWQVGAMILRRRRGLASA